MKMTWFIRMSMQTATFHFRIGKFYNISYWQLAKRVALKRNLKLRRLTCFVLTSFHFGLIQKENKKNSETMLIEEADKLYAEKEILRLYEHLLPHKTNKNEEILWRLARATCEKGDRETEYDADKKACFQEAFQYANQALELQDENSESHKWYAIILDRIGKYEGIKTRISNAFEVKKHFMRAVELNPKDAISLHSIGYWCFAFADMPWYQRQIASALFATPPTSTYDEALDYFQKAEESEPEFYSMNLLMLAKTFVRQENYTVALKYLQQVREFPIKTTEDQQAHTEALHLLKKIPPSVKHRPSI